MEMTKNQYKEYLKNNASRLYTDSNYTIADYEKDADSVTIIPIDLSEYKQITPETAANINKLFDEEDKDRNGNYMLRGFVGDSVSNWIKEKELLKLNYAPYGFYYSGFGFNDAEMLIYTWCEGDTTLTLFKDRETYQKARIDTENWYEENT